MVTKERWRRLAAICITQQPTKQSGAPCIYFVIHQSLPCIPILGSQTVEPISRNRRAPTAARESFRSQPARPRRGRLGSFPKFLEDGSFEKAAAYASCQQRVYDSKCWSPVICSKLIPNARLRDNFGHSRRVDIFVSLWLRPPHCTTYPVCAKPSPQHGCAVPLAQACALRMPRRGTAPPDVHSLSRPLRRTSAPSHYVDGAPRLPLCVF